MHNLLTEKALHNLRATQWQPQLLALSYTAKYSSNQLQHDLKNPKRSPIHTGNPIQHAKNGKKEK